jgi:predicted phage tail protein
MALGWTTSTISDHTGVVAGATYYYAVQARNSAGTSTLSPVQSFTVPLSAPATPTGVSITFTGSANRVSWSPVPGATDYNVFWGTSAGLSTSSMALGWTTSTISDHTGVVAGATYYYAVQARNSAGTSGLSTVRSITVP